jgi:hypothetical protein
VPFTPFQDGSEPADTCFEFLPDRSVFTDTSFCRMTNPCRFGSFCGCVPGSDFPPCAVRAFPERSAFPIPKLRSPQHSPPNVFPVRRAHQPARGVRCLPPRGDFKATGRGIPCSEIRLQHRSDERASCPSALILFRAGAKKGRTPWALPGQGEQPGSGVPTIHCIASLTDQHLATLCNEFQRISTNFNELGRRVGRPSLTGRSPPCNGRSATPSENGWPVETMACVPLCQCLSKCRAGHAARPPRLRRRPLHPKQGARPPMRRGRGPPVD